MSAPDVVVRGRPYPKGSGSRKLIPANCPNCYKRIPMSARIGRLGPFVETCNLKTTTRPSNALKKFAADVSDAARRVYEKPLDEAVEVRLQFRFPKPTGKTASKRLHPTAEEDIDKLARTVLDALTGIAFVNDSRVVKLRATKIYAASPGVAIRVRSLSTQLELKEKP